MASSKPIRGTTIECYRHFVANHPDADVLLKEACNVNLLTARRWIARNGKLLPAGKAMNALRVYLWDQGYEVAELAKIDSLYRELAFLVGRGKVSAQDAFSELELGGSADELWRLFRGDRNLSENRRKVVQRIVDRQREQETRPAEVEIGPPEAQVGDQVAQPQPAAVGEVVAKEAVLAMAASHVAALGPLLTIVNGDTFSDDDRVRFRKLAGGSVVFDTANALNQLCSTKARKMARSGRTKEVANG